MYRSLSKLLQETQATAAKKLGVLENTIADDYSSHPGLTEYLEDMQSSQSFGTEKGSVAHQSSELLTVVGNGAQVVRVL